MRWRWLLPTLSTLVAWGPSGLLLARAGAEEGVSETLLRGLEGRLNQDRSFSGRDVVAFRSSDGFYSYDPGSWTDQPWTTPPDGDGWLRDVGVEDFDWASPCWRIEVLQLVCSRLNWFGFFGLGSQPDRQPRRLNDLYVMSACDGERVFRYDRTLNQATIRGVQESDKRPPGYLAGPYGWLLATVDPWMPGTMRREMQVEVKGKETMDGVECYVLVAVGNHADPKGYVRLWIASERDFGVVRMEHVETGPHGRAVTCDVTRATGWAPDEASGYWTPRTCQLDCFRYHVEPNPDFTGLAWSEVRRVIRLSCGAPVQRTAWVPMFPFDTNVVNADAHEPISYLMGDVHDLLEKVQFEDPDPFGELLAGGDPRAAFE